MDVIYLNRISTDNKDQDPTSNLDSCKNFCKYNNHKIKYMLVDKGVDESNLHVSVKNIKIKLYICLAFCGVISIIGLWALSHNLVINRKYSVKTENGNSKRNQNR